MNLTSPQSSAAADFRHPGFEKACVILIACGVVLGGLYLSRPDVLGLYHDDGIYVATAKSLAQSGEYRLINVPTAPYETKYPPLYSIALALVWKLTPDFPANIRALKSLNALLLGVICLLTWGLGARLAPHNVTARIGATLCVASSPFFLILADLAVSDALFTAAFVAFLIAIPHDSDRFPTRRLVLACVAVAVCSLTRAVGSVLWLGIAIGVGRRRDRTAAVAAAVCFACSTGAWMYWRNLHRVADPGFLGYYLGYEANVLDWIRSDPALAANVFFQNVIGYSQALWFLLGIPWAGLAAMLAVSCGIAAVDRRWPAEVSLTPLFYLAAISIHPLALARYLLPLAPLALVGMSDGAWLLAAELAARWPARRVLLAAVSALPLLAILTTNVQAVAAANAGAGRIRIDSLAPSPLNYAAFPETAKWIVEHKSAGDVVAARHDPFYFLFAGVIGVRPWVPHPEIYSDEYRRRWSSVGSTDFDQSELDRLGVTILVNDQGLPGAEERYVSARLARLLHDHSEKWQLQYVTRDGKHRIYRRTANSSSTLAK